MDLLFKPVSDVAAMLGESPCWSAEDKCVWWVDIPGKRLHQTFPKKKKTNSWDTPEEIGFVVLTQHGEPIVGMESGLFRFDPKSGEFHLAVALGEENVRFNDATVDDAGRLWAGTMDMENKRPVGVLYLVGPDFSLTPVIDGMQTPNGLATDGKRLFISDSHPTVQTIWVADLDVSVSGLGPRQEFVRMHDFTGRPDGASVDANGNYWIAGIGGGVVHVFAPDATHLYEIETPFEAPTKPIFGGKGLDDLYLTSKGGAAPNGVLSRAKDCGFVGRPVAPFQVLR